METRSSEKEALLVEDESGGEGNKTENFPAAPVVERTPNTLMAPPSMMSSSILLMPRNNSRRPGRSGVPLSSRGRKRRSDGDSSYTTSTASMPPPMMVSFVPTHLKKSVVTPLDTPATYTSSTTAAARPDEESAGKEAKAFHIDSSPPDNRNSVSFLGGPAVQRYLESPGGLLGGALSGLALHSPRPSPSFFASLVHPTAQIFSHEEKSSPFSLSSCSRTSRMLSSIQQDSSPPVASPFSSFNSLPKNDLRSNSITQESTPAKTAPLRVVMNHSSVAGNRGVACTAASAAGSSSGLVATKLHLARAAQAQSEEGSSPTGTPLPTCLLKPRGGVSPPILSQFGSPSGSASTSVEAKTDRDSARSTFFRSSRPSPSVRCKPSSKVVSLPSSDKQLGAMDVLDDCKKTESCDALTSSEVSFIPLPEWNNDQSSPKKPNQRAVSLWHTSSSDLPDPIDQFFSTSTDEMNDLIENDSLSDDAGDSGAFLLVAPREIEEERVAASSSRPSKRPYRTMEEDWDNFDLQSEWSDSLKPLPQLRTTSGCGTVAVRDLITPPAMKQSNSPPPLLPPSQQYFE